MWLGVKKSQLKLIHEDESQDFRFLTLISLLFIVWESDLCYMRESLS